MIERLLAVRIGSPVPRDAIGDYRILLGRAPDAVRGPSTTTSTVSARWELANAAVEVVAAESPGVAGLVFAGDAVARSGIAASSSDSGCRTGPSDGRDARLRRIDPAASRGIPIWTIPEPGEPPASGSAPSDAPDAIDHVVVQTDDPEAALRFYGHVLGLRLALDRRFEQRGLRILFFRVGGVTVEVVSALDAEPTAGPDRFFGVAYRVADLDATVRRLTRAGVAVSSVRDGHKPGTRVATVCDRTAAVPTLLLSPEA